MEFYYVLLGSRPLWVVFIVTVVLVLLSVYIGYKIGNHVHRKRAGAGGPAAGSIVAASLGLLAFMLAFTFGIASNRYDTRKQLVLKEVNTSAPICFRNHPGPKPESS
jgi:putative Mn2+ efflux pump MntP